MSSDLNHYLVMYETQDWEDSKSTPVGVTSNLSSARNIARNITKEVVWKICKMFGDEPLPGPGPITITKIEAGCPIKRWDVTDLNAEKPKTMQLGKP